MLLSYASSIYLNYKLAITMWVPSLLHYYAFSQKTFSWQSVRWGNRNRTFRNSFKSLECKFPPKERNLNTLPNTQNWSDDFDSWFCCVYIEFGILKRIKNIKLRVALSYHYKLRSWYCLNNWSYEIALSMYRPFFRSAIYLLKYNSKRVFTNKYSRWHWALLLVLFF